MSMREKKALWLVWVSFSLGLAVSPSESFSQTISPAISPVINPEEIAETRFEVIGVRDADPEDELNGKYLIQPNPQPQTNPFIFFDNPLAIIDTILKIWQVVQDNKPVVNVNMKSATALPAGSENDWTRLTGWQPDRIVTTHLVVLNGAGQNAIDITGDIRLTFGGRLGGRGLYIASARFIPVHVSVLWAFGLNVSVNIPSVINRGTDASPVGEITMAVTYQMSGTFFNETMTDEYVLRADGYMANPSKKKVYAKPVAGLSTSSLSRPRI